MNAALQELETFEETIDGLFDYHRDVARSIWPNGTMLRCPKCGRTQTATSGEMANYLAKGMPTCCNERMHLGDQPAILPMAG